MLVKKKILLIILKILKILILILNKILIIKLKKEIASIEYPKKIYCEYAGSNNKILVSNGKSLVIKTSSSYYRILLEKHPYI